MVLFSLRKCSSVLCPPDGFFFVFMKRYSNARVTTAAETCLEKEREREEKTEQGDTIIFVSVRVSFCANIYFYPGRVGAAPRKSEGRAAVTRYVRCSSFWMHCGAHFCCKCVCWLHFRSSFAVCASDSARRLGEPLVRRWGERDQGAALPCTTPWGAVRRIIGL